MEAILLATGSELLADRLDTNGPEIARELQALGHVVIERRVLPDDAAAIASALREACARPRIVVTCGGLGPTNDDVTRDAVASVMGTGLVTDVASAERIESRWRLMGHAEASASALRQALVPEGAVAIPNLVGAAPGAVADVDAAVVILLPGPPNEMRPMIAVALAAAERRLRSRGIWVEPRRLHRIMLRLAGIGESAAADRVAGLPELADVEGSESIEVGWLAHPGDLALKLHCLDEARLMAAAAACRARLAEWIYSDDGRSLADVVLAELVRRGETLGTAESCTGGMIGARITAVPGSSAAFRGSVVAYSNDVKTALLAVSARLLLEKGAVSSEVAMAMAHGARRALGCDFAVSVTGIAGPEGGTEEKPVGLVHFGLAHPDGRVEAASSTFTGSRDDVRERAASRGLDLVRLALRQT